MAVKFRELAACVLTVAVSDVDVATADAAPSGAVSIVEAKSWVTPDQLDMDVAEGPANAWAITMPLGDVVGVTLVLEADDKNEFLASTAVVELRLSTA